MYRSAVLLALGLTVGAGCGDQKLEIEDELGLEQSAGLSTGGWVPENDNSNLCWTGPADPPCSSFPGFPGGSCTPGTVCDVIGGSCTNAFGRRGQRRSEWRCKPPIASPTPPTVQGIIEPGQGLPLNTCHYSPNGWFRLCMQGDGNLVLYDGNNYAHWFTGTVGSGAYGAYMQRDANLVIYTRFGQVKWASKWQEERTPFSAEYLAIQDDSNIVIYDVFNDPVWDRY